MTTNQQITVSLEVAKRLAKAGWPQDECIFRWHETVTGSVLYPEGEEPYPGTENLASPTAEEILRRLPAHLIDRKKNGDVVGYDLHCQKLSGMEIVAGANWKLWYFRVRDGIEVAPLGNFSYGDTLANASASMFCFLKENNLLPKL